MLIIGERLISLTLLILILRSVRHLLGGDWLYLSQYQRYYNYCPNLGTSFHLTLLSMTSSSLVYFDTVMVWSYLSFVVAPTAIEFSTNQLPIAYISQLTDLFNRVRVCHSSSPWVRYPNPTLLDHCLSLMEVSGLLFSLFSFT